MALTDNKVCHKDVVVQSEKNNVICEVKEGTKLVNQKQDTFLKILTGLLEENEVHSKPILPLQHQQDNERTKKFYFLEH